VRVEHAPAKLNLLLQVGAPRTDGLHPLCSIFVALDLVDEVRVEPAAGESDTVSCPGVEAENLAARALAAYRAAAPRADLAPLSVQIQKRIPVAGGLGGGSADAAAVLRAADALAGERLEPRALREVAAGLGADVPSQLAPRSALVQGVGERVEPIELPPMAFVLVTSAEGLSTPHVYGELDRLRAAGVAAPRSRLEPDRVRGLARAPLALLASRLENDLQVAALSLRPALIETLAQLGDAGALAARVTGSGPTAFGVFADRAGAEAAAVIPGSMVAEPL